MKVWIDQDLCTGDGICTEICPSKFDMGQDGLAYVKNDAGEMLTAPGEMADFDESLLAAVEEACDDCPGECIFIVRDE
jgi:ferredoxin